MWRDLENSKTSFLKIINYMKKFVSEISTTSALLKKHRGICNNNINNIGNSQIIKGTSQNPIWNTSVEGVQHSTKIRLQSGPCHVMGNLEKHVRVWGLSEHSYMF